MRKETGTWQKVVWALYIGLLFVAGNAFANTLPVSRWASNHRVISCDTGGLRSAVETVPREKGLGFECDRVPTSKNLIVTRNNSGNSYKSFLGIGSDMLNVGTIILINPVATAYLARTDMGVESTGTLIAAERTIINHSAFSTETEDGIEHIDGITSIFQNTAIQGKGALSDKIHHTNNDGAAISHHNIASSAAFAGGLAYYTSRDQPDEARNTRISEGSGAPSVGKSIMKNNTGRSNRSHDPVLITMQGFNLESSGVCDFVRDKPRQRLDSERTNNSGSTQAIQTRHKGQP